MHFTQATRRIGLVLAASLTMLAACTDSENQGTLTAQIGEGPSISTDQTSYAVGDPVTTNYAGLPGNAYDWVAISSAGAPDTSFIAWDYTGGLVSGAQVFSGLAAGNYEARVYENDSFTRLATSTFTIAGNTAPAVTSDATTYAVGQTVAASFSSLPGNPFDWVSVSAAGSPDTSFVAWAYVNAQTDGVELFSGLTAGTYEVRAYLDDSFTVLARSTSFTVTSATTPVVTTSASSYLPSNTVVVNFADMPGNANDWVSVAVAGSPVTSYVAWFYINGQTSGSESFVGLPAGSYEARAYLNDSFTLLATSTFDVSGAPGITTDAASYPSGATIDVQYSDMPGNTNDWVSVAIAGSPVTSFVTWAYVNGQVNGTLSFAGLADGTYEARSYSNDSFTLLASSPFTVGP